MGTVPEAFPSIQVGIPEQGVGGGVKGGKKGSDESPDPQLFAALMAQYASPQKTDGEVETPALERVFAVLRGGLPQLSPVVLDLLASLKEGLQKEAPEALMFAEGAAEEVLALPEEELRRLEALLSRAAGRYGDGAALAEAATRGCRRVLGENGLSFGEAGRGLLEVFAGSPAPRSAESGTDADEDETPAEGPEAAAAEGAAPLYPAVPAGMASRSETASSEELVPSDGRPGFSEVFVLEERGAARAAPAGRTAPADERALPELYPLRASGETPAGREKALPSARERKADEAATASDRDTVSDEPLRPLLGEGEQKDAPGSGDDAFRRRPRAAPESDRGRSAGELPRTAERTEPRPDFQTFFDGILANRRLAPAPSVPLDLNRGTLQEPGSVLREGLENVVRFARVNGERRASLIVDPPALGRLTVELTSGTSGIEANIKVSSEQVRHLVQDQVVQLRMSLAQQGVQLAHFSVDVQQDDGRRQRGFDQGQGNGNRRRVQGGGAAEDDEAAPVFRVDLNEGLLHWVG